MKTGRAASGDGGGPSVGSEEPEWWRCWESNPGPNDSPVRRLRV